MTLSVYGLCGLAPTIRTLCEYEAFMYVHSKKNIYFPIISPLFYFIHTFHSAFNLKKISRIFFHHILEYHLFTNIFLLHIIFKQLPNRTMEYFTKLFYCVVIYPCRFLII